MTTNKQTFDSSNEINENQSNLSSSFTEESLGFGTGANETSSEYIVQERLVPGIKSRTNKVTEKNILQQLTSPISSWSIRLKATLLAMGISIIPLVAIGGTTLFIAKNALNKKVAVDKLAASTSISNTLNSFLYERFSDIEAVANLPVLKDPAVYNALPPGERSAVLTQYAETYGIYDSIAAFDLKGNPIAQSKGKKLGNHLNREYIQGALKSGKRYVGQPQFSTSSGKFAMYWATPLKDPSGKIVGIVRTRMPLKVAFDDLLATFTDNNRKFLLVDANGEVISASNQESINKPVEEVIPKYSLLKPDDEKTTQEAFNNTVGEKQFLGALHTPAYRDMPNLNWNVVSTIPTKVAFAEEQQLLFTILGGLGLASLVVAALAYKLSETAIRPIERATEAVTEIGQGDLSVRVDVSGEDELAILGENVNALAANLEAQKIATDKANKEREAAALAASSATSAEEVAAAAAKAQEEAAAEQQAAKEFLEKRALELLMEVDPVSKGDLTVRANVTPDQIGTIADSYNSLIRSLRKIVTEVQEAAGSVTTTAQDNESAVNKVAEDATAQVAAISEALTKLEAMSMTSQEVAERAQKAEAQVQQAVAAVQEGDAAMDQTVEGISTIRDTVSDTAKKVKRLGEASQKISKVVNLISNFAAQTNLLALNASIEAARAGEEGRGFSVVAEEVRALAQQSAAATADIEELVVEIQTQTNEVVVAMEEGTEQVVAGTKYVEESREKLNQIALVSEQISRQIQEIASTSAEQTVASATVSQTMQEVSEIANDTSKQSEDVATSFRELLEVSEALQTNVAQFKVS